MDLARKSLISIFLLILAFNLDAQHSFSIGLIADCQYCSDPGPGVRKYALSTSKLSACVKHFNQENLKYVIHLGDFIDRDFESFAVIKPIYDSLSAPSYHVLGNHDFSVTDSLKLKIPQIMGLPSKYYSFDMVGWRFIVLDGNDISFHAYAENSKGYRRAVRYYKRHALTSPKWNGAMGEEQMQWLDQQLADADTADLQVILYCHFPVSPENVHNLWNANEVLQLIKPHKSLKAFINGHNHAGNYACVDGIHFLTLKGMVDTTETAYAILDIEKDMIVVRGFGREENRVL
ncbi:MAG: metallophosphoesterase, partial [Saprospiraceae bacterium]|nr:metallophosphoesterase [Saprospiraceae bacterium]